MMKTCYSMMGLDRPFFCFVSGIYIAQLKNDSIYDQYVTIGIDCL